jgi:2,5-diamino-6-(ribosylamino)-4(3H)-pyrimidinone 5'-phosphate reductase
MTHYLRSKHDAIIVGVGTAIADNPSLNCRMTGAGGYGGKELENQPRPIILDPRGRWNVTPESKMIALAREGKGKAPWIFTCFTEESYDEKRRDLVEKFGGQIFVLDPMWIDDEPRLSWHDVFRALKNEGINSVMVEGGASVVNQLLSPMYFNNLVDTVIVTIAPTWLGKGGVQVCPEAKYIRGSEAKSKVKVPVARLKAVKWIPLGEDVVLCGHPRSYEEDAPVVENNDVIEE